MSEDCIFCAIVSGDIPSRTVYENEAVLAFLDVNPLARGHTLVIPKTHHHRIGDLPGETATAVFEAVHELTPAVEASVDAPATTVAINNGEAAGQEVPHVHAHIIPRFEADGASPVHALFDDRPSLSDADLDEVALAIESALA